MVRTFDTASPLSVHSHHDIIRRLPGCRREDRGRPVAGRLRRASPRFAALTLSSTRSLSLPVPRSIPRHGWEPSSRECLSRMGGTFSYGWSATVPSSLANAFGPRSTGWEVSTLPDTDAFRG